MQPLPMPEGGSGRSGALLLSRAFAVAHFENREEGGERTLTGWILLVLTGAAFVWLTVDLGLKTFG